MARPARARRGRAARDARSRARRLVRGLRGEPEGQQAREQRRRPAAPGRDIGTQGGRGAEMELSEYLDAITRESGALADAAERAGLDAPVPSCPDWTVADLLVHLGGVQQWARITV